MRLPDPCTRPALSAWYATADADGTESTASILHKGHARSAGHRSVYTPQYEAAVVRHMPSILR